MYLRCFNILAECVHQRSLFLMTWLASSPWSILVKTCLWDSDESALVSCSKKMGSVQLYMLVQKGQYYNNMLWRPVEGGRSEFSTGEPTRLTFISKNKSLSIRLFHQQISKWLSTSITWLSHDPYATPLLYVQPTEYYDERNAMEERLGEVSMDDLASEGLLLMRLTPNDQGRYGFIVKVSL